MSDVLKLFTQASDVVQDDYLKRRKVEAFGEYLDAFFLAPRYHLRDAARFMLDAIDYYGTVKLERPWGSESRYKIFDQEFAVKSERLVGQESAQVGIRDSIAAQVRDGAVNRLIIIHGPNGSAKSTMFKCLARGLEHYSRLEEGMLYRYRWIFPSRKTSHGTIGFGARLKRDRLESFAHLDDDQIDATLECEVRDHPLLLLPRAERLRVIETALKLAGKEDYQVPDYFLNGSLCHRCRQVADSLMRTHEGDLKKVLAHVQVERWAMSRRYRRGIVQVGPQMSVDAGQRQITADRSLSALPTELQNMTLFETYGPLVDGAGGFVEFEDMLKRPLDAFKYLLGTVETGEAMLGQSILICNTVFMGTTNDDMLEAFREHHEYPSFRDRLTLIAAPYLTQRSTEAQIYELQLVPTIGRHVSPHAVMAIAHWAVLTRLHKPNPAVYSDRVRPLIARLTAGEKCDIYEDGSTPPRMSDEDSALLREVIADLHKEDASTWSYEGRFGASTRLIRQLLLQSSLSEKYKCLSPFAVLDELADLCNRVRENPFLERTAEEGGYHDHRGFVSFVEQRVLDAVEQDVRAASGLVEEARYFDLMDKYIINVSHAVKHEKVYNESRGDYAEPDESLMRSVEKKLGSEMSPEDFRRGFISKIAAWAIENPRQKIEVTKIFPDYLKRLKHAYFEDHRQKVAEIAKFALALAIEQGDRLEEEHRAAGTRMIENLVTRYGYCKECCRDGLAQLFNRRFRAD